MSPELEKRFAAGAEAWNLDTVIGGRVVAPQVNLPEHVGASSAPVPTSPESLVVLLGGGPVADAIDSELKISFEGLQSFVGWYFPLKDKFSKEQQEAFNSLCALEVLVNSGCSCSKSARNSQAQEYYKNFFLTNHERGNDLIGTIKTIAGVSIVKFFDLSSSPEPFLVV